MKYFKLILLLSVFILSSCTSTINKVGAYADKNPIFAKMLSSQLVLRFIEASPFPDVRKDRTLRALRSIKSGIMSETNATVATLMEIANSKIPWGKIKKRSDRDLVKNLIVFVQGILTEGESKNKVDLDAKFSFLEMIDFMILRAETF